MKKTDLMALCKCRLFSGLDEESVNALQSEMELCVRVYKKHENIFSPQSYNLSLAVLLKGAADVHKQTERGALFLSVLVPGSMFGMAGLFYEGEGFINTVSAREDCRVVFISKARLEQIFIKYPQCVNNYITLLSQKIHYLNSKIQNLTEPSPSIRLLSFLEATAEAHGSDSFTVDVSFSELADMLSMGRTSLYRAFDELCEKQLVHRNGKQISILKPKGQI